MNEKYKSKLPALVGAAMLNEWGSDVKQSILTPKQLFIHKESSPGHAHPAKQSAGMTSKHSPQNHPVPRSRLPHALLFQSGQTLKKPLGGVTVSQGSLHERWRWI